MREGLTISGRIVQVRTTPTYQIIKVTNANHMSTMKTNLTVIPMCPRGLFALYKSSSRLILCYKKDWATFLHFIYFHCLLPVTNYLITKLSVTYNFSAWRENLTENRLSFPSALIERTMIDPLYLWVIKTHFWHCRGVKRCRCTRVGVP